MNVMSVSVMASMNVHYDLNGSDVIAVGMALMTDVSAFHHGLFNSDVHGIPDNNLRYPW
jgi:hypothetical protein